MGLGFPAHASAHCSPARRRPPPWFPGCRRTSNGAVSSRCLSPQPTLGMPRPSAFKQHRFQCQVACLRFGALLEHKTITLLTPPSSHSPKLCLCPRPPIKQSCTLPEKTPPTLNQPWPLKRIWFLGRRCNALSKWLEMQGRHPRRWAPQSHQRHALGRKDRMTQDNPIISEEPSVATSALRVTHQPMVCLLFRTVGFSPDSSLFQPRIFSLIG